jgi:lysophospholipase L1-like esterase
MRYVRGTGRWAARLLAAAIVMLLALAVAGFASATVMDRPAYRFPADVVPAGGLSVVVAGDSLARGMRARDLQHGFAGLVFGRIAAQIATLPAGRVDLVLLVAGGNDVMAATDPVSLARAERAAFDAIAARAPEAVVIYTNVPDVSSRRFTFRPLGRPTILPAAMRLPLSGLVTFDNALVDRIGARRGAVLVDLQSLSRTHDANDPRFISRDGLHPNDAGHARLAAFAWPAVAAALQR